MACILAIDGRVPWTDHEFSVFSYSVKMPILLTVFTTSSLVPLRRYQPRFHDPIIGKLLVVLAITTSICWILTWKDESSSLFTYCSKLGIFFFTFSTLSTFVVRLMKHEKPNTVDSSLEHQLNLLLLCALTTINRILRIDAV